MNEDLVVDQMKQAAIDYVTLLPCDRIKHLIPRVKAQFESVDLTREEIGVGLCAGAALSGKRPAMLIQSTGAGTVINELMSLPVYYRLPLPMLVSWRGHYKEGIAAQVPLGRIFPDLLASVGIETIRVETPEEIPRIGKGIERAFSISAPVAILLSPRIFEDETDLPAAEDRANTSHLRQTTRSELTYQCLKPRGKLTRFEALRAIAPHLTRSAVVVNIGVPSKEYFAVADAPSVFYMLGSLGLATAIGLGIAPFTDRRVTVIDGDGSLLMSPNILQHVATYPGDNLTVVAIDNGVYGSTGNQTSATGTGEIDLELLARAYGIRDTAWAVETSEINRLLKPDRPPRFIHLIVSPGNEKVPSVALEGIEIKSRFMEWLQRIL